MKMGNEQNTVERMDGEVYVNENQVYDVLVLTGKGCLNIGGLPNLGVEEIRIKIGELQVDKSHTGRGEYDLKFTSPREGQIRILVEIGNLQNDIFTMSCAPDGMNGRNGSDGGKGGSSPFGTGGRGGDGGDGEDGMDGADCPDVTIIYSSAGGSGISHTAVSSAGGRGGAGGKGGQGGLCADKKTYAASGADGRDGRDGRPGGKGSIVIKEQKSAEEPRGNEEGA